MVECYGIYFFQSSGRIRHNKTENLPNGWPLKLLRFREEKREREF
jgi:hypothetical protein